METTWLSARERFDLPPLSPRRAKARAIVFFSFLTALLFIPLEYVTLFNEIGYPGEKGFVYRGGLRSFFFISAVLTVTLALRFLLASPRMISSDESGRSHSVIGSSRMSAFVKKVSGFEPIQIFPRAIERDESLLYVVVDARLYGRSEAEQVQSLQDQRLHLDPNKDLALFANRIIVTINAKSFAEESFIRWRQKAKAEATDRWRFYLVAMFAKVHIWHSKRLVHTYLSEDFPQGQASRLRTLARIPLKR